MFRLLVLSVFLASVLAAKPTPTPVAVTTTASLTPVVAYNAMVKNVVDGDTFDVVIDVWTDTELKVRVRLAGVDCPELHAKDKRKKAMAQNAKAFTEASILDKPVLVMRVDKDSFGRTLAKVMFEKDGVWVDLGDELVRNGLAMRGYDPSRF